MRAVVFFLIFAIAFASSVKEGEIICNLCKDTVNLIQDLLTVDGANAVKQYIHNLCQETTGFLNTLCNKVLVFGVDELVKLIENHLEPEVVCQKIHACH